VGSLNSHKITSLQHLSEFKWLKFKGKQGRFGGRIDLNFRDLGLSFSCVLPIEALASGVVRRRARCRAWKC